MEAHLRQRPSGNANYDFDPGMARPLITSHPAKPEELRRIIDNVAANRPDTFIQEVYNAGWTLYFRSRASSTTPGPNTGASFP